MLALSRKPSSQNKAVSSTLSSLQNAPRFNRLALTSAVLLALAGSVISLPASAEKPERFVQGRLLVQPRAGLPEQELTRILSQHGGKALRRLEKLRDVHIIEVAAQDEEAVMQALASNPHIKYVERDRLLEAAAFPTDAPNDTYYSWQWHLPKIQASGAWTNTLGAGVTVAVLDTGVDAAHADLNSQLVPGWNTVDNNTDTADSHGHGTQVAGAVVAATNNSQGVASVAAAAQVMPIRVSTAADGAASVSEIAEGLIWAADHGAKVANVSYDVTASPTVNDAAQYMRNAGGVVVVAAGNGGVDYGYSNSPYMITVAGTDSADNRYSSSNYGNHVDLAAPGSGVWTTSKGGGYSTMSGTSIASPLVAGVAALIRSVNPELLPADVETILLDSADLIAASGCGRGRVNAAEAVAMAQQSLPDTQAPVASIYNPTANSRVSGLVTVDVGATDNVGTARVDLYANGSLVASDTTEPFAFSWNTSGLAEGPANLVAYAVDAAGNQGGSSTVTVTVDNVPDADTAPPTATVNSPGNNSSYRKSKTSTVSIRVSATDNVGVTQLSCYVGSTLLGTTNSASLTCTWNVSTVATGTYTITAKAKDAAGNTATSSAVQVKIQQ